MRKAILFLSLLFLSFMSITFATTKLDQAISWMNNHGLTKFTNPQDFMANNGLRRDEATKFFVQYATEIVGLVPDTSKTSCSFSDINKARPDLKDLIKQSCQLGLFQGTNGKFMPTQSLTNAQAITVLIRMIDGKKDETQGHFAQKYFEKAQELGIMSGLNLNSTANFDKLTTRGEVGILLLNASNVSGSITTPKTPEEVKKEQTEAENKNCEILYGFYDCLYIKNNIVREGMSERAFDIVNDNLRTQGKPYYKLDMSDSYLGDYYCEETDYHKTCFWISDGIVGGETTIYY